MSISSLEDLIVLDLKELASELSIDLTGAKTKRMIIDLILQLWTIEEINNELVNIRKIEAFDEVNVNVDGRMEKGMVMSIEEEEAEIEIDGDILWTNISNLTKEFSSKKLLKDCTLQEIRTLVWKCNESAASWIPLNNCLENHHRRASFSYFLWKSTSVSSPPPVNLSSYGYKECDGKWLYDFGDNSQKL